MSADKPIAITLPASTKRTGEEPRASVTTTPAAMSPPKNATAVPETKDSVTPLTATTVKDKYAPALTARVSGDAKAFLVSACISAPAPPRATPTTTPASNLGNREFKMTVVSKSDPRPVAQRRTAPGVTFDVPCIRCITDRTTTRPNTATSRVAKDSSLRVLCLASCESAGASLRG